MRRVQKGKRGKPRKKTEPLAEGIIPLKKNGHRDWESLRDDEIVGYARNFTEGKIGGRTELKNVDSGLYEILLKRKLLDEVFPPTEPKGTLSEDGISLDHRGRRLWSSMDDEDLVRCAKLFIEENGISGRGELQNVDMSWYQVLRKRGLLGAAGVERIQTDWTSMSDEQLIAIAKRLIADERIKTRWELQKRRRQLYRVLSERDLLDVIRLESKHANRRERRDWRAMGDEEMVRYAKRIIREHGITKRTELIKADGGLYQILGKRKLLDSLFPHVRERRPVGFFRDMEDKELIRYAKDFIEKNGIVFRGELGKKDASLYQALRGRGLIARSGLIKRGIAWSSMSRNEIFEYAQRYVEANKITGRHNLEKANRKLYRALRERDLLDIVFLPIEEARESEQRKEAVQEVLDAIREYDSS